jgi:glutamate racemase
MVRGPIGVIATAGTIASGAYVREVAAVDSRAEVIAQAAPLLVPLVEEGWLEGEVVHLVVRKYLLPLAAEQIDVLLLGCTHYPVLHDVLGAEMERLSGNRVPVVDSARATAQELRAFLEERGLLTKSTAPGHLRLMVTDLPIRFRELAGRFLGQELDDRAVEQIDL